MTSYRIYPATLHGLEQAVRERGRCKASPHGCLMPDGHNPELGHSADTPPQWALDKMWSHVTSVKVLITYFKPSGKYYTEEEVEWPTDSSHWTEWKAFEDVARIKNMIAVCMVAPHGFPQMHVPPRVKELCAPLCNAPAPCTTDRCTLAAGHEGDDHECWCDGRLVSGWHMTPLERERLKMQRSGSYGKGGV